MNINGGVNGLYSTSNSNGNNNSNGLGGNGGLALGNTSVSHVSF